MNQHLNKNFQFGEFWIKTRDDKDLTYATIHDLKTDEQFGSGQASTIETAIGIAVLNAAEVLQRRQR